MLRNEQTARHRPRDVARMPTDLRIFPVRTTGSLPRLSAWARPAAFDGPPTRRPTGFLPRRRQWGATRAAPSNAPHPAEQREE